MNNSSIYYHQYIEGKTKLNLSPALYIKMYNALTCSASDNNR